MAMKILTHTENHEPGTVLSVFMWESIQPPREDIDKIFREKLAWSECGDSFGECVSDDIHRADKNVVQRKPLVLMHGDVGL